MDLVADAQQRRNTVGHGAGFAGRRRRYRHVLNERDAAQLLHHCLVRHEDDVVLVVAHTRLPLAAHHAQDGEGLIGDTNHLADRADVGRKQLIARNAAEDGGLGGRVHVLRCEESSVAHRPRPNQRKVDVGPLDLGIPVQIAGHDLRPRVRAGRHVLDAGQLRDRGGVFGDERAGIALSHAHAALAEVARRDDDHVGAGRLDLRFDGGLSAGAERHHRDHGCHADDHAEHRQRGPQLVAAQRLERDAEDHEDRHQTASAAGGSAASSSWALRRRATARSATTWPSRNVTVRVPYSAMSISCVISTTLMPRS